MREVARIKDVATVDDHRGTGKVLSPELAVVRMVGLDEPWVERTLAIILRSYEALPAAARRFVDHLRRAAV